MSFSITNWNVAENIKWYVRMVDAGTTMSVYLYDTEEGANAGDATYKGYATGVAFGSAKQITLTIVADAISKFQEDLDWHLIVSGTDGSSPAVLVVGKFTDLPEIKDPLYVNPNLVVSRATAEVNLHTHSTYELTIELGAHFPTLNVGDVVRFDSTRLGRSVLGQVGTLRTVYALSDNEAKLVDGLVILSYGALRRVI